MIAAASNSAPAARGWALTYRTIWRWHFYAGLFCIPFVVLLATTGSIYLFKPQIEALIDSPVSHLQLSGHPASAEAQVRAALVAVPGTSLHSYELPQSPQSAVPVIVGRGRDEWRVYVHPENLSILKTVRTDERFMQVLFHLHGELLMGDKGSAIVELAASWTVVMIVTGLYLWWPRNAPSLGGVIYPRIGRGRKSFWRDLHAVTGFWISGFVLLLLLTGLPWAKQWGGNLKEVRQITGTAAVRQDWATGRTSELAARMEMDSGSSTAGAGSHGDHGSMPRMESAAASDSYRPLDRLVPTVAALNLAPPVHISPPNKRNKQWTAAAESQNRMLRENLELDGASGGILSRSGFDERHPIDQVVGIGISVHEGQLFGIANQMLGVLTALGLICLCASSVVLWLRRRPEGVLGAPDSLLRPRFLSWLGLLMVIFGLLLPLLGISMIVVAVIERLLLARIPRVRDWLGLPGPMAAT